MSAPLSPERLAEIRDRHAAAELGALYPAPEPFAAPGTIRATIGGVPLTVAVMDFRGWKAEENRQFILRAHEDVRELLADRERFADRTDMAARIAELELAVGSAVLGLHSISIRVNAGQVPDVAGLERDADELRRVQHGSVEGAESRLWTTVDARAEHEFAVEAGHAAPDRVLPWLADLDPGDVQDLASALAAATVGWQREPEIVLARVEWALEEIRARVADGGESR